MLSEVKEKVPIMWYYLLRLTESFIPKVSCFCSSVQLFKEVSQLFRSQGSTFIFLWFINFVALLSGPCSRYWLACIKMSDCDRWLWFGIHRVCCQSNGWLLRCWKRGNALPNQMCMVLIFIYYFNFYWPTFWKADACKEVLNKVN